MLNYVWSIITIELDSLSPKLRLESKVIDDPDHNKISSFIYGKYCATYEYFPTKLIISIPADA